MLSRKNRFAELCSRLKYFIIFLSIHNHSYIKFIYHFLIVKWVNIPLFVHDDRRTTSSTIIIHFFNSIHNFVIDIFKLEISVTRNVNQTDSTHSYVSVWRKLLHWRELMTFPQYKGYQNDEAFFDMLFISLRGLILFAS